jgi:hypothetical protein
MIAKHIIEQLVSFDCEELETILSESGYTKMKFESCWFAGIVSDLSFCYDVTFLDDHTGRIEPGKVYLKYNESEKKFTAEF